VHEDGGISNFPVSPAAWVEQHAVDGERRTSSRVRNMMLGGADTFTNRGEHAAARTRSPTNFRGFIVPAHCPRRNIKGLRRCSGRPEVKNRLHRKGRFWRKADHWWPSDATIASTDPRPLLADTVAKVENRTGPKIPRKLIF
jgi:hypothetical protein